MVGSGPSIRRPVRPACFGSGREGTRRSRSRRSPVAEPALHRAILVAVALAVPPFLIGTALLVLVHPWTADAAYALPGFPNPSIDLGDDERSRLAAAATGAIQPWRGGGVEAMRGERLDDGRPAFTEAEMRHFGDVREVVVLFLAAWAAGLAVITAAAGLVRDHSVVRRGLVAGAWLTIGAFAVPAILMLVSFRTFFEGFHAIFFEGDTWRLPTQGTARSLYPDAFWALMGGAMAVLVLVQAAAIVAVLRRLARRGGGDATAQLAA